MTTPAAKEAGIASIWPFLIPVRKCDLARIPQMYKKVKCQMAQMDSVHLTSSYDLLLTIIYESLGGFSHRFLKSLSFHNERL